MSINTYSTWLDIDLAAITANVSRIKQITNNEVMGVIKANGYGHGALPAAQAAIKGGATWCGVARIEEALALRQAGISCKLLVLGYTPPTKIPDAIDQQIDVTLYNREVTEDYLRFTKFYNGRLFAHVKVETGMGRLGLLPRDVLEFLFWLKGTHIVVNGIFTHFARADAILSESTPNQIMLFNRLLAHLENRKIKPSLVHAANSAAIFNFPDSHYDMVRPGIAIYGISPSKGIQLDDGFKPALSWKARIISVHRSHHDDCVKNKSSYPINNYERIGVIPIGFGDGFRRIIDQEVLVNEKRVKVIGNVSMDHCLVQLENMPDVHIGDEVVLLGKQGNQTITAEEIALRWGTNNYEVVSSIAARLPRIYK